MFFPLNSKEAVDKLLGYLSTQKAKDRYNFGECVRKITDKKIRDYFVSSARTGNIYPDSTIAKYVSSSDVSNHDLLQMKSALEKRVERPSAKKPASKSPSPKVNQKMSTSADSAPKEKVNASNLEIRWGMKISHKDALRTIEERLAAKNNENTKRRRINVLANDASADSFRVLDQCMKYKNYELKSPMIHPIPNNVLSRITRHFRLVSEADGVFSFSPMSDLSILLNEAATIMEEDKYLNKTAAIMKEEQSQNKTAAVKEEDKCQKLQETQKDQIFQQNQVPQETPTAGESSKKKKKKKNKSKSNSEPVTEEFSLPWKYVEFSRDIMCLYYPLEFGKGEAFYYHGFNLRKSLNGIKPYLEKHAPMLMVVAKNRRIVEVKNFAEFQKTLPRLYEYVNVRNEVELINALPKLAPGGTISVEEFRRHSCVEKSPYLRVLSQNQINSRKIMYVVESLTHHGSTMFEGGYLFTVKDCDGESIVVYENTTDESRSSIVFRVRSEYYNEAVRAISSFFAGSEMNKREKIAYRRLRFISRAIIDYDRITHSSYFDWQYQLRRRLF